MDEVVISIPIATTIEAGSTLVLTILPPAASGESGMDFSDPNNSGLLALVEDI
jgi:hypothetical protein